MFIDKTSNLSSVTAPYSSQEPKIVREIVVESGDSQMLPLLQPSAAEITPVFVTIPVTASHFEDAGNTGQKRVGAEWAIAPESAIAQAQPESATAPQFSCSKRTDRAIARSKTALSQPAAILPPTTNTRAADLELTGSWTMDCSQMAFSGRQINNKYSRVDINQLSARSQPPPEMQVQFDIAPDVTKSNATAPASTAIDNLSNVPPPSSHPQLELQPTDMQPAPAGQPIPTPETANGDEELGTIRARELEAPPPAEESVAPETANGDEELGTIRTREVEASPEEIEVPLQRRQRSQPFVYLSGRAGYFLSNNVFSAVDPINDGLIFSGLTLSATPKLGPTTYLVTSVDGNLINYLNQSQLNYQELRLSAGIYQRLTPRMFGEIGTRNQQLFTISEGDRFLNEQALYLSLSRRDPLTDKLILNSFYDLRISFADPESRSRLLNSLYVSLNYYIQNNLQVGLGYQYGRADFTQQDRLDEYHRLLGSLTLRISPSSSISAQGGASVGSSSNPLIDFDSLFFNVTYNLRLGQF